MRRRFNLAAAVAAATLWFAAPALAQGSVSNPSSPLTLTSTTTAYTANKLIANNATAASVVVPQIVSSAGSGGWVIPRVRLDTNDATSTAWGGQTIQVDLWNAAPTFQNGDRGAWSILTGSDNHVGSFTCVMSTEQSDGAWAECAPTVGNFVSVPAPIPPLFWTLQAITGSGVTGASKVFTLTPEILN